VATESELELSTAQLARQTGVSAGTLRAWEARYGFPEPIRVGGGHHRYGGQDVGAVTEVVRLRGEGLSMTAAILRARAAQSARETSIYAALRRRRPDLQAFVASKRSLLELTRAIEDTHCAQAGTGVMIGSFQRERHYRQSERRWQSLSRTLALTVALADFDELRVPDRGVAEVPVERDHQLSREWTLIVNSGSTKACLAAWELPEAREVSDLLRRFEVVWSFDPVVVHDATLAAAGLLETLAPELGRKLSRDFREPPAASPPELRFAAELAARTFGYMTAKLDAAAAQAAQ
jgi:MerR family transcriptional regulator, light-induced transcriptional regulator